MKKISKVWKTQRLDYAYNDGDFLAFSTFGKNVIRETHIYDSLLDCVASIHNEFGVEEGLKVFEYHAREELSIIPETKKEVNTYLPKDQEGLFFRYNSVRYYSIDNVPDDVVSWGSYGPIEDYQYDKYYWVDVYMQ